MGISESQGSSGNNNSQQQGGTGNNSSNGQGNNGNGIPKNYESHEANPGEGKAKNETGELGNASSQMKSLGQKGETGDSNYNAEVQRQKGRFEGKEFKGQIIQNGMSNDIVDTTEDTNKSAEEKYRNGQARLRAAVEIAKQMHAYGGDNPGFLERMVEKALAPKVNWRSVLRKFLIKSNKKEYTLSHPDKRFLGQKSTDGKKQVYAGPHKYGGGDLENIKIAIDTSGSITPKDLGVALTQIEDMFKKYSAHAELLYWDSRVRAVYEFDKVEELLKKEPMGGGGTDVNCVFDYFESAKEYKMRRKPKPSLILIFTDGVFGEVNKAYSKKYKNTIWILHDNDEFKAPFGILAPFKISDM